jgi:tetratricopeptide (TPR) repeat protein
MYHQKKSMEDDVDEHIKLKIKYDLSFREDKPSSFLFDILRRLDHGEELLEEDFIWLIENDLCGFLIKILDPLKKSATNAWYLIKSSRILRRMKKPNIALKITEKMQLQDNFQKSAVCTTRGAAFKDLEEFDKAIVLAEKAIYFQPAYSGHVAHRNRSMPHSKKRKNTG